jgi:uncharacterized membrane protein
MAKPGKEDPTGALSRSETDPGTRPRPQGREAGPFPSSEVDLSEPLRRLLERYPLLQRHPHPFIVHFPIVFTFSATFFSLVYLVTGVPSFETTAYHCLGAAVLSIPLAMLSGELSRRVNYPREPERTFSIERQYSWVLLALGSTAFLWRWLDPSILRNLRWDSVLYLTIVLSLPILATIISYFGGLLTFPLENGPD